MIERMSDDGALPEDVQQWIQAEADRHHGGNFGRAAAAILTAAYRAEQEPENAWAYIEQRARDRTQSG
jgi:hypothetical protein